MDKLITAGPLSCSEGPNKNKNYYLKLGGVMFVRME